MSKEVKEVKKVFNFVQETNWVRAPREWHLQDGVLTRVSKRSGNPRGTLRIEEIKYFFFIYKKSCLVIRTTQFFTSTFYLYGEDAFELLVQLRTLCPKKTWYTDEDISEWRLLLQQEE